jgi:hypothetical protein
MQHWRHLVLIITAVLVVACLGYVWWEPASQSASTVVPPRAAVARPVPVHTLNV